MDCGMNSHRFFKALLLGVCVCLLLTACDKREYNSTTVLAGESENNALSDEASTGNASGATVSGGGVTSVDSTALGDVAQGGAAGSSVSGSSGTSDSYGETAAGQNAASGNAVSDSDPIVVSSSDALNSTLVGQDAADATDTTDAADAAGMITTVDGASESDLDAADTAELESSAVGESAGVIGASVPEGPDIDRVGLGSLFQPFADEETATFTIDGRASFSLAAVGGPVLTSPRAVMEEIDEYFLNNANQAAFSGRFSDANEFFYGVWAGDVSNPSQIFATGTAIPGLQEDHTYFRTLDLAMDNRGVMSQLAEVQGESLIDAYIVSEGSSHSVLMQSDTSVPGLIGAVDIDFIEIMSQANDVHGLVSRERIVSSEEVESAAGTAQANDDEPEFIDVVTSQYSIWYLSDGTTRPVAHSFIDASQRAPSLGNGCSVHAPDNKVDNSRLGMTSGGLLIFQAQLAGSDFCEGSRAVMRFDGSSYQEVVKDGDSVPGSATHIFDDVSLYSLTDDGSAIIFANLTTQANLDAAEQAVAESEDSAFSLDVEDVNNAQWSFWIMPQRGGSRLLALQGEEIQIGRTVTVLSGEPQDLILETNASNQVALKLLPEDTENPVYLVGSGHAGQPHASLETPGASALSYAFTSNSALPGQSDNVVLASLGTPYLDDSGNLILYGEVELADEAEELALADEDSASIVAPYNSIWQINAGGTIRELVRSGDEVSVAGIKNELASLSVSGQIARSGTFGVRVNSSGALLLRANIEQKFGNSVLLYIAP